TDLGHLIDSVADFGRALWAQNETRPAADAPGSFKPGSPNSQAFFAPVLALRRLLSRLLRRAAWFLWIVPRAAERSIALVTARKACSASAAEAWASLSRNSLIAPRMECRRQRLRARRLAF